MAETLAIYGKIVRARLRAAMQYRASFAIAVVGDAASTFMDFIAIAVMFRHTVALGGWTVREVAFLYGISAIAFAITDLMVGYLDWLPNLIRSGQFDSILVRPLGTLFQVVSIDFALRRIGKAAQGAAVFAYALAGLDVDWTAGRIAMTVLTIVCATVIFTGVWVATVAISFWIVDAREMSNAVTYGGNFLAEFPLTIFGEWVRRLFAFVIPMGFVAYFPALYILDKPDYLGMPAVLRFLAPLVAGVTSVLAFVVWRTAVRHYRSTGS